MININGLIEKSRSRNRNRKQHNGLIGKTRLNGPIVIGPCLYTPGHITFCENHWPRNRAPFPFTYIFFPLDPFLLVFIKKFGFHMNERFSPCSISTVDHRRSKGHRSIASAFSNCALCFSPPIAIPSIHSPPLIWSSDRRPALNRIGIFQSRPLFLPSDCDPSDSFPTVDLVLRSTACAQSHRRFPIAPFVSPLRLRSL